MTRSLATVLTAATLVALPVAAPPSGATSTYLCTGYTACANAGYSNAGYAANNRTMYWRMYSGHNCTNYVAYRMVQAGMSNERPWTGSGNASNWGDAMRSITNTTPTVGSVAWYRAGVTGAGSSGHVAYVERVVSSSEIVISEDSWSGDFHWRTIYKNGPGWPSGFIHFLDRPATPPTPPAPPVPPTPVLTTAAVPRFDGTPRVGVPLHGYPGTFAPSGSAQTLQWLVAGVAVPGATGVDYTPVADDLGETIVLRSTATRSGYVSASSTSAPSAPVAAGTLARVAKPAVSGSLLVGSVLRIVPGQWSPAPEKVTYRWRADGVWLGRALNGTSLTLTPDLLGTTISAVEVTRLRGYDQNYNTSADLGPVVTGVVELTDPFRASGEARYGSTLVFTPGTWSPSNATAGYEWTRDGVVVPGATAPTLTLGPDDVGHQISVRATVSRENYRGLTRTADFGTVTTPSDVVLRAGGRRRGANVRVRVTAPGAPDPTGTVWARVNAHVVRGEIVDGFAELKLTDLRAGPRTVLVVYAGNGVVEPGRVTARVIVKP